MPGNVYNPLILMSSYKTTKNLEITYTTKYSLIRQSPSVLLELFNSSTLSHWKPTEKAKPAKVGSHDLQS